MSTSAMHISVLVGHAVSIADEAVLILLRSECAFSETGTYRWYDTRPMLDEREHSGPNVDQHRQCLEYASLRHLVFADPDQPHLVRLLRAG